MKYGYMVVMAGLLALYLILEEPKTNKPIISAMDFEEYTAVRVVFEKSKYDVTFIIQQNEALKLVCDESAASRKEVTIAHDRARRTFQLNIWPLNKRLFLDENEIQFFKSGVFRINKNFLKPSSVPGYVKTNLKDPLYFENEGRLLIRHER